MAVERVFFQVNAKTAMSVGQANGLALAAAAEAGCPVVEYTANEVKQALVGYGSATKDQVQRMVASVLKLPAPPRPPDVGRCARPGDVPSDDDAVARGPGRGGRSAMTRGAP